MNWTEGILVIRTELIASGITLLVMLLGKRILVEFQNAILNRKHKLSGDYITYYVDKENGHSTTKKATLKIKQTGLVFRASNKNLDDEREWELRGEILPNGNLVGNYGHLDPNNSSKGTFFLEADVSSKGSYRGHWTGYDSVNREIASGEYIWRKRTSVSVRTLSKSDKKHTDEILGVFSEGLGSRFIKRESIEQSLNNKHEIGAFLQAAFLKKKIVGVRIVRILDDKQKKEFQGKVRLHGGACSLDLYKVGMLASNAVSEQDRRQGIGSTLVESGIEFLKKKGCTACIAVSWQSGSIDSSASVLESYGFKNLASAQNYWKEESLEKKYECPKCGNPPCECGASFYFKKL